MVAAYIEAARRLNMAPAAFQAVCWLVWKRLHAPAEKRAVRRHQHHATELQAVA